MALWWAASLGGDITAQCCPVILPSRCQHASGIRWLARPQWLTHALLPRLADSAYNACSHSHCASLHAWTHSTLTPSLLYHREPKPYHQASKPAPAHAPIGWLGTQARTRSPVWLTFPWTCACTCCGTPPAWRPPWPTPARLWGNPPSSWAPPPSLPSRCGTPPPPGLGILQLYATWHSTSQHSVTAAKASLALPSWADHSCRGGISHLSSQVEPPFQHASPWRYHFFPDPLVSCGWWGCRMQCMQPGRRRGTRSTWCCTALARPSACAWPAATASRPPSLSPASSSTAASEQLVSCQEVLLCHSASSSRSAAAVGCRRLQHAWRSCTDVCVPAVSWKLAPEPGLRGTCSVL